MENMGGADVSSMELRLEQRVEVDDGVDESHTITVKEEYLCARSYCQGTPHSHNGACELISGEYGTEALRFCSIHCVGRAKGYIGLSKHPYSLGKEAQVRGKSSPSNVAPLAFDTSAIDNRNFIQTII